MTLPQLLLAALLLAALVTQAALPGYRVLVVVTRPASRCSPPACSAPWSRAR